MTAVVRLILGLVPVFLEFHLGLDVQDKLGDNPEYNGG